MYQEQNQDVTIDLLNSVKEQFDIILLAFPDGPRHYEVEDMVYGVGYKVCHNYASFIGVSVFKWARAWQNQQNDMHVQRTLRSAWASTQSDQSQRLVF